jgi:hypothetical protein
MCAKSVTKNKPKSNAGIGVKIQQEVSTFQFERQNIAGCCKQTHYIQFNIKSIQSKT